MIKKQGRMRKRIRKSDFKSICIMPCWHDANSPLNNYAVVNGRRTNNNSAIARKTTGTVALPMITPSYFV